MVRTTTTAKRPASKAGPRRTPSAAVRPSAYPRAGLELAGRRLRLAGRMAGRVARTSMHEVTTAARASREPMFALWRNVRLAGRHIARDALEAWKEVMPMPLVKPAAKARRASA